MHIIVFVYVGTLKRLKFNLDSTFHIDLMKRDIHAANAEKIMMKEESDLGLQES